MASVAGMCSMLEAEPDTAEGILARWLSTGLHKAHDLVLQAPLPDDILRILTEKPLAGSKPPAPAIRPAFASPGS
jgi:hypothetical protein